MLSTRQRARQQPDRIAAHHGADVIVRQAPAAQSVFRGIVRPEGLAGCDVLQVWVDLASHPSRGREQADLIRKRVLQRVIEGGDPEK